MQQSSLRVQELNPGRLTYLFRKQFEMSKVQKGETVAIVSDLGTRREYIQSAFAAADEYGADIYEMCVNSHAGLDQAWACRRSGNARARWRRVCAADMIVIFHVPLFSQVAEEVMDGGTRVLMIIDAPDELEQLMSPPGPQGGDASMRRRIYKRTKNVRVTSEAGTDLTYRAASIR